MEIKSHRLAIAGLMIAIGLVLPFFTAHMFAVPGTLLLPMHIPVILSGLLCGPKFGALVGIMAPLLSSMLTGMPVAYPMLPIMATQLFLVGLLTGLLYEKLGFNIHLSILGSMLAGWAAYGMVFELLLMTGDGELRALSVMTAITVGTPGIAIQLFVCPLIVKTLNGAGILSEIKKTEIKKSEKQGKTDLLDEARSMIKAGDVSCVVIKDGSVVHTASGRGVSPLRIIYEDSPEVLKDAFVVDKIIGKAAAVILLLGGAKQAHGIIMSFAAKQYLETHGIAVGFDRCVDVITARSGTGICAIEKSVIDIDDPHEAYDTLTRKIEELRKAG